MIGVAVVALTVACTPAEDATTTAAEHDLTVSMFEWGFGPATITVAEGSGVVLHLRNDGALVHDLAILSTPIESEEDLHATRILVSARVEAGATEILEFVAPATGNYQIICSIAGHLSNGMEGALIVAP